MGIDGVGPLNRRIYRTERCKMPGAKASVSGIGGRVLALEDLALWTRL